MIGLFSDFLEGNRGEDTRMLAGGAVSLGSVKLKNVGTM